MSLNALIWASNDAPIKDVNEFAVLVKMADRADDVGRGVYFSQATIAKKVQLSDRKIRDALAALEERKIIGRGDQRRAEHIRADRRPVVWDLLIPYGWFRDIEEINDDLVRRGEPMLTPGDRPPLGPAPGKKRRSDLGVPRKAKGTNTSDDATAGITVRPPKPDNSDDPTAGIAVRPEYESATAGIAIPDDRTAIPPRQLFETVLKTEPPPPTPMEIATGVDGARPPDGGEGDFVPKQKKKIETVDDAVEWFTGRDESRKLASQYRNWRPNVVRQALLGATAQGHDLRTCVMALLAISRDGTTSARRLLESAFWQQYGSGDKPFVAQERPEEIPCPNSNHPAKIPIDGSRPCPYCVAEANERCPEPNHTGPVGNCRHCAAEAANDAAEASDGTGTLERPHRTARRALAVA